jgi:hypothetical protein
LAHTGINRVAESFFSTLEIDLMRKADCPTRDAARTAVFAHLETWWNPK